MRDTVNLGARPSNGVLDGHSIFATFKKFGDFRFVQTAFFGRFHECFLAGRRLRLFKVRFIQGIENFDVRPFRTTFLSIVEKSMSIDCWRYDAVLQSVGTSVCIHNQILFHIYRKHFE